MSSYKEGQNHPSIRVSEISRILINVKKNYMNRYHGKGETYLQTHF